MNAVLSLISYYSTSTVTQLDTLELSCGTYLSFPRSDNGFSGDPTFPSFLDNA